MSRRRVTMLEAFQTSARKSVEKAASEKRRLAEEREREARRAEMARTTQAWKKRIGEGVGSLWAGIRGEEAADDEVRSDETQDGPEPEGAPGAASTDPASADLGSTAGEPGSEVRGAAERSRPAGVAPITRGPAPPAHEPSDAPAEGAAESRAEAPVTGAPVTGAPVTGASVTCASGAGVHEPDEDYAEALAALQARLDAQGASGALAGGADSPGTESPGAPSAGLGGASESPEVPDAEVEGTSRLERRALEDALAAQSQAPGEFTLPLGARAFVGLAAALVALVFALGYQAGRTGAPAHAAEPDAAPASGAAHAQRPVTGLPAAPQAVRTAPPAGRNAGGRDAQRTAGLAAGAASATDRGAEPPAAVDSRTAADRAFDDPRTEYSILAATYKNTEANRVLVWEAYDLLAGADFPVVSPVLLPGDRLIYLLVGAAEHESQLRALETRLKAFESRGRREFSSAWIVSVDSYR